tara:strand:+ start:1225 stop:4584 length:3360 start_codon:yes stop_codon:yes gene_type:complete
MKAVTQSDMDNLATSANSILWPKIQSALIVNDPSTIFQPYSRLSKNTDANWGTNTINPYYNFPPNTCENIIPSNAAFNGSGEYTFTCPSGATYLFESINSEQLVSTDWDSSNPVYFGETRDSYYGRGTKMLPLFFFTSGTSITINGTAGQKVRSYLVKATSWLYEINRVRGDLMRLYRGTSNDFSSAWTGSENYLGNQDFLISGKWVVGVNNATTYLGAYTQSKSGSLNYTEDYYDSSGKFIVDNADFKNCLFHITNAGNVYYVIVDGNTITVPDYVFVKKSFLIFGEPGALVEFAFNYSSNSIMMDDETRFSFTSYITIQNLPDPFYYKTVNSAIKASSGTIQTKYPGYVISNAFDNLLNIDGTFALECGVYITSYGRSNIFNNVEFHYAENDASSGLSVYCEQSIPKRIEIADIGAHDVSVDFTQSYSNPTSTALTKINGFGDVTGKFSFTITLTASTTSGHEAPTSAPSVSSLNLDSYIGSISGTLKSFTHTSGSTTSVAVYSITVDLSATTLSGDTEVAFTADLPSSGWSSVTGFINNSAAAPIFSAMLFRGVLLYSTSSTVTTSEGIHPSSNINKIACGTSPTAMFSVGKVTGSASYFSDTAYRLSLPLVDGLWIANTYPVPARNCVLDSYLNPYKISTNAFNKIYSSLNGGYAYPPVFTNLRQYNPIEEILRIDGQGYYYIQPTVGNVDLFENEKPVHTVYPAITLRPSKWITLKDSTKILYNNYYQYWPINSLEKLQDPRQSNSVSVNFFDCIEPISLGTPVKIILSVSSDYFWGWKKNGLTALFEYGANLPITTIKIAWATVTTISHSGFNFLDPNAYDGQSDSHFVEIYDSAIISDFLTHGYLFVSVFNMDTENASPAFYISEKLIYSDSPMVKENTTSGFMMGAAYLDMASDTIPFTPENGTTPPAGYTIYKLKASRQPENGKIAITPQSGNPLTVYIGQWKNNGTNKLIEPSDALTFTNFLQPDGTTLVTLTIPANKSSSDEVDVFISSFYGSEIIYQCDEPVVVEAFADFQPVFFNKTFNSQNGNFLAYLPTIINQCLRMIDYASSYAKDYSLNYKGQIQYPLDYNIYKDLVSILSGMNTQGAGGAGGSGGGAGGPGGAGGGSSDDI